MTPTVHDVVNLDGRPLTPESAVAVDAFFGALYAREPEVETYGFEQTELAVMLLDALAQDQGLRSQIDTVNDHFLLLKNATFFLPEDYYQVSVAKKRKGNLAWLRAMGRRDNITLFQMPQGYYPGSEPQSLLLVRGATTIPMQKLGVGMNVVTSTIQVAVDDDVDALIQTLTTDASAAGKRTTYREMVGPHLK